MQNAFIHTIHSLRYHTNSPTARGHTQIAALIFQYNGQQATPCGENTKLTE